MKVVKDTARSKVISPGMSVSSKSVGDLVQSRVLPRQVSTGIMRGTQGVGTGGVKIDSANNRITLGSIILDGNTNTITVENDDGSTVGLGPIPDTSDFGFFATDTEGNVVQKIVGPTRTINDIENGVGRILDGKLPDDTYGTVMAKEGIEVEDVFS